MRHEKTILLVEDNHQDELLTIRALRKHNISNRIDVVRDGQEAVDYLFRRNQFASLKDDPFPYVVLLDLKLPKLDGLQVLKRIREHGPTKRLPVVVLTTSLEGKDVETSYDLGANSYVRKPVDYNEFTDAVLKLGIYWLAVNECAV